MSQLANLLVRFDPDTGDIPGIKPVERRLSALRGYFADQAAYDTMLAEEDPVLYAVTGVEGFAGEGQLQFGIGRINPGRVGAEYYMTKGHLHAWRPAAELYIGLSGEGLMLLEEEHTGAVRLITLTPNTSVYVPGNTAHRTINTGNEPLVYMGVYPAAAGHDYAFIQDRNFRNVVVEQNGKPVLLEREAYLRSI